MSNNRVKWCDDPIPGKHSGDYKKVIYRRDIDAYECVICGRVYEKNTIKYSKYVPKTNPISIRKILKNL